MTCTRTHENPYLLTHGLSFDGCPSVYGSYKWYDVQSANLQNNQEDKESASTKDDVSTGTLKNLQDDINTQSDMYGNNQQLTNQTTDDPTDDPTTHGTNQNHPTADPTDHIDDPTTNGKNGIVIMYIHILHYLYIEPVFRAVYW